MRVLLDENLPRDLAPELSEHHVETVQAVGWSGVSNGELLRRAAGRFDAFLTMDQGLPYQQNLTTVSLAVLIVRAPSNRISDLRPLLTDILATLTEMSAGEIRVIGA